MHIARVTHHALKRVSSEDLKGYREGADFKRVRADPVLRNNWVAFTALQWSAAENCLYVGLTAWDADLLWRFWPDTGRFESLGFATVPRDPQGIKIHRGLISDGQGGYYFGTAGLPDLDELDAIPGGAIYHYQGGEFRHLGIPVPHDYIQCIAVDPERRRVVGVTDPITYFFDYDLDRRATRRLIYTASHFHESARDDDGCFWGTWAARRGHCLFRYNLDAEQAEFFEEPIPNLGLEHIFNFPGNGPIDSFINGGDGYLYFGTTPGALYRLDPKTGQHMLLGRPSDSVRLSSLIPGPGAKLIGSCGAYDQTGLFTYDRATGAFEYLGAMRDDEAACFMIHEIAWDGGERVFAAETDNNDRSSYLWEARLG